MQRCVAVVLDAGLGFCARSYTRPGSVVSTGSQREPAAQGQIHCAATYLSRIRPLPRRKQHDSEDPCYAIMFIRAADSAEDARRSRLPPSLAYTSTIAMSVLRFSVPPSERTIKSNAAERLDCSSGFS